MNCANCGAALPANSAICNHCRTPNDSSSVAVQSESGSEGTSVSAVHERPDVASWMRFGIVAVGGLLLDLWSKNWAFDTLRQGERMVILPHVLEFQTMLNKGALFGIGPGLTPVFVIASIAALALVGWMFLQTSPRRRLLHIALGAILAGALGNMYDRIWVKLVEHAHPARGGVWMQFMGAAPGGGYLLEEYPPGHNGVKAVWPEPPKEVGFVRDFIKIPTKWLGGRDLWPWVFNVADMLLVCGVSVLALHMWFDRKRPAGATDGAESAGAVG